MTKKRLALIAVVPLTVAVALGVWLSWPPPPGITPAHAARIMDGMTRRDVEAILGGPARSETPQKMDASGPEETWNSDTVRVVIVFDADNRVMLVTYVIFKAR